MSPSFGRSDGGGLREQRKRFAGVFDVGEHLSRTECVLSDLAGDPLQAGYWVKFTALDGYGANFSRNDFFVEWRITNTDRVAAAAGQLRGDFYSSDGGSSRTEHLEYRGVHFVEAFVIRKRDDRQVGQSQPFYVVVE